MPNSFQEYKEKFPLEKLSAKDGLIWFDGEAVMLPLSDWIAYAHGFYCAEQVVRLLEERQRGSSS